jgi:asparagine synthetase A
MTEPVISKSLYKILADLTGETRFDVALHLATKELVQLKLKDVKEQIERFEQRYGMDFDRFKQAWDEDRIVDKHSYEVERDYWEWEAAVTDRPRLQEMLDSFV